MNFILKKSAKCDFELLIYIWESAEKLQYISLTGNINVKNAGNNKRLRFFTIAATYSPLTKCNRRVMHFIFPLEQKTEKKKFNEIFEETT